MAYLVLEKRALTPEEEKNATDEVVNELQEAIEEEEQIIEKIMRKNVKLKEIKKEIELFRKENKKVPDDYLMFELILKRPVKYHFVEDASKEPPYNWKKEIYISGENSK